ncbi:hypothetical protein EVAR_27765_1 [Eumeta japonica]|uniref:Uncharacterized protein n=1 Tax=Eumeta variegata TaxID=151549 RepID=A0A4C1VD33_EUMVA|nr:hypothetical protein EVAR_27765_1 [Eumeta japonica]
MGYFITSINCELRDDEGAGGVRAEKSEIIARRAAAERCAVHPRRIHILMSRRRRILLRSLADTFKNRGAGRRRGARGGARRAGYPSNPRSLVQFRVTFFIYRSSWGIIADLSYFSSSQLIQRRNSEVSARCLKEKRLNSATSFKRSGAVASRASRLQARGPKRRANVTTRQRSVVRIIGSRSRLCSGLGRCGDE